MLQYGSCNMGPTCQHIYGDCVDVLIGEGDDLDVVVDEIIRSRLTGPTSLNRVLAEQVADVAGVRRNL